MFPKTDLGPRLFYIPLKLYQLRQNFQASNRGRQLSPRGLPT